MNDKGREMTTTPGWVKGLPPAGRRVKLWWLAPIVRDDTGPHFDEIVGVEVSKHEDRLSLYAFMSEDNLLGGLYLRADQEYWKAFPYERASRSERQQAVPDVRVR